MEASAWSKPASPTHVKTCAYKQETPVSKAQAQQRTGRANLRHSRGRELPSQLTRSQPRALRRARKEQLSQRVVASRRRPCRRRRPSNAPDAPAASALVRPRNHLPPSTTPHLRVSAGHPLCSLPIACRALRLPKLHSQQGHSAQRASCFGDRKDGRVSAVPSLNHLADHCVSQPA